MVGMREREQGFLDVPVGHSVRAVLVALAALVLDHVALDVEALLVKSVQEESHPVGFEPEGQL